MRRAVHITRRGASCGQLEFGLRTVGAQCLADRKTERVFVSLVSQTKTKLRGPSTMDGSQRLLTLHGQRADFSIAEKAPAFSNVLPKP
jgi:hypothetical protein